jgi:arginine decarboxylase
MASDPPWTPRDAAELYGLAHWGDPYFGVSDAGTVEAYPDGDPARAVDLHELLEGLAARQIHAPVVLRFPGILEHRMRTLRRAFDEARAEAGYQGDYSCVYPIKVNQQRHICEEIREVGRQVGFGLEAGSKPELLAGLALTEGLNDMPLICNGFKDEEFIETALLAAKMGRNILPVAEQAEELELIVRVARRHRVTPRFGVRAKLAARGIGRWAQSTGIRGKFGLSVSQMVNAVDYLREEGMLEGLRMLHCHVGSQIYDIRTVKYAVNELTHLYVELVKLGAPLEILDLGGGMGVDYDGSGSARDSSVNYSVEEYATDVIHRVQSICDDAGVPHPDLVTESGRALVAHSGVLAVQVLGRRVFGERPDDALLDRALAEVPEEEVPQPLLDLADAWRRLDDPEAEPLESYHDAEHALGEAMTLFNLGYMSITARAACEELYWAIGTHLVERVPEEELPEELADLGDRLGDLYITNFSLFQSLIDAWGIDQVFPVVPLQRLDERPTRLGVLADITCDSDGRLDRFPGESGPRATLPLHPLGPRDDGRDGNDGRDGATGWNGEPYWLGIFLTGAYQETLGDLHNLFGDTHAVHVSLAEDGSWRLDEVVEGDTVRDVLRFVQYDPDAIRRTLRREIEAALSAKRLTLEESVSMRRFLDEGLDGYTYLE